MSNVVVLVKDGRCWQVLKKEGDLVEYADADGVVIQGSHARLLEQGLGAWAAQRATKANGDVLHFILDADSRVTSAFLNNVVIPPVTGRRYAGPA